MNRYEVEVEVCYLFGVEAENEREAEIIAQMMLHERAPALECVIASICVEKVQPGNTASGSVQRPPHGLS